jgi:uncharacterized protein YijF (DUF1287 family)
VFWNWYRPDYNDDKEEKRYLEEKLRDINYILRKSKDISEYKRADIMDWEEREQLGEYMGS